MSDMLCVVCNEPWDAYGARHGDMAKWEYELFRKGAGCPCCEGDRPEGLDESEAAEAALRQQIFEPTDDDEVAHGAMDALQGMKRPKWQRPEDPWLWRCDGCETGVRRDLDDQETYSEGANERYVDPCETEPPFLFEGKKYCGGCMRVCRRCDDEIFASSQSATGTVLYGDTYDPGASFLPDDCYLTEDLLCINCFEDWQSEAAAEVDDEESSDNANETS
ncbi:MAG: hypothetical protein R3322_00410 [Kiloniellales bacterium]|nr:hypothetical protein [Kiloniellales bacterium]